MKKYKITHSLKNITIPPKKLYLKYLIDKTDSVLRRMKWMAFFLDKGTSNTHTIHNFGFKSGKHPPSIKDMERFEEDLIKLIKNVRFNNYTNHFQKELI